jgi:hypothetical protein
VLVRSVGTRGAGTCERNRGHALLIKELGALFDFGALIEEDEDLALVQTCDGVLPPDITDVLLDVGIAVAASPGGVLDDELLGELVKGGRDETREARVVSVEVGREGRGDGGGGEDKVEGVGDWADRGGLVRGGFGQELRRVRDGMTTSSADIREKQAYRFLEIGICTQSDISGMRWQRITEGIPNRTSASSTTTHSMFSNPISGRRTTQPGGTSRFASPARRTSNPRSQPCPLAISSIFIGVPTSTSTGCDSPPMPSRISISQLSSTGEWKNAPPAFAILAAESERVGDREVLGTLAREAQTTRILATWRRDLADAASWRASSCVGARTTARGAVAYRERLGLEPCNAISRSLRVCSMGRR